VIEIETKYKNLLEEVYKTQVIVLAGGKAKRMGLSDEPKPMLKIGGERLIDRTINYYRNCGFEDFILLVGYMHDKIKNHVGDGSKYRVNITYSEDPNVAQVGKAKALKHALQTDKIDRTKRSFITSPDDLFLDDYLPLQVLPYHINRRKLDGVKVTGVFVPAMEYPYGTATIDENCTVSDFAEKPLIKRPTYTGLCIVEPEFYNLVEQLVDLETQNAIEIEKDIFPRISKTEFAAFIIPEGHWLPVNTQKDAEKAEKILENVKSKK
jgi:NDP-sugar pyrophosphorylase family protein